MAITFACPGCKQTYRVPDDVAGRKTQCKKCGMMLLVPSAVTRPAPPPAAPIAPTPMAPPTPEAVWENVTQAPAEPAPRIVKRRSRKKLFILLGAAFLVLGLCLASGVGVGLWWYFSPSGPGDELKYMPDNCQMLASVRVEQILKSDAYAELKREVPEAEELLKKEPKLLLPLDDIAVISMGLSFKDADNAIVVIQTKSAVSAADIKSHRKNESYKEVQVGRYTLYEGNSEAFCIAESKLVVFGKAAAVRKVLERDKKPELSEGMKAAIKQVDFSKSMVVAINTKGVELPKSSDPAGPANPVPGPIDLPDITKNLENLIKEIEGVGLELQVRADMETTFTLICQDSKTAEDYRKLIDGIMVLVKKIAMLVEKDEATAKELGDSFDAWKCSTSGNKVVLKGKSKVGPLIKLYKDAEKGKLKGGQMHQ
jgi:hypothetical protein